LLRENIERLRLGQEASASEDDSNVDEATNNNLLVDNIFVFEVWSSPIFNSIKMKLMGRYHYF
jgi:hypothetical protein